MPDIQNIPTTQYIGPRIIPHLWDPILWNAATQYDALAVVQYEGAYYVARYVPPLGTPPTNTTYWVKWADFNAQMAQLQQTVETFDNRITANANAVASETQARQNADQALEDSLSDDIQAIGTQVETTATELRADLLNARQNFRNARVVIIGDSWNAGVADGAITNYDIANGWGSQLANRLHMNRSKILNYGQPSAGFVSQGGSQQRTFRSLLDDADEALGDKRSEVAHIIVAGGINDASDIESGTASVNDVQTAVTSFCNRCATRFPNAIVHVFPMLFPGHVALRVEDVTCKQAIVNGAKNASAPVDVCEYASEWLYGRAGYFGSGTQGRHTTIDGLVEVSRFMALYLSGSYARFCQWTSTYDTATTKALNITQHETQIKDGMIRCHVRGSINNNYDGTNVPFFILANGNTYFKSLHPFDLLATVSGFSAPATFSAQDGTVKLTTPGAATLEVGKNVYFDLVMPFAF